MDEKIRKAAIRACKSYGSKNEFTCPVCGKTAFATKSIMGLVQTTCSGCKSSKVFVI